MKVASHKRPRIIWISSYEMSRVGKYIKTEGRLAVAWGWYLGWGVRTDC